MKSGQNCKNITAGQQPGLMMIELCSFCFWLLINVQIHNLFFYALLLFRDTGTYSFKVGLALHETAVKSMICFSVNLPVRNSTS